MDTPDKIDLSAKLALFSDRWSPKIVAELNGQHVKLAKLEGEFVWHRHENEDELFLVLAGRLRMKLRSPAAGDASEGDAGSETEVSIGPGEMIVVPRRVEHLPIADEEVHVLLFEPASTLNTGNVESERTVRDLDRI